DLYAEFGVSRDASPTTLKKAYHRLCLKYHPDKLRQLDSDTDKAAASAAFQRITHWHHVLQDPDRRARYDETGFVGTVGGTDEENGIDIRPPDQGWDAFFRELWGGLITVDKIESFKLRYRGSDAERADVIDFYLKFKGNMGKVLESVPTCTWEDEERFRGLVQTALDAGDLTERHDAFFKVDERATERRRKQAEKE
ncbi:DnaJ domain-containing protein, partial [Chytriomyces sp. MP71]